MKVDFDIQGMVVQFDNLFNGNKVLGECLPHLPMHVKPNPAQNHKPTHATSAEWLEQVLLQVNMSGEYRLNMTHILSRFAATDIGMISSLTG
jgi:hypothetical protein